MEVLQLTSTVDTSGYVHLDIATQLAPGQVNVVVVINPVIAEDTQKSNYDFSDLAGKLSWRGDAIEMQRSLRDEW
jgi:hypothetical protein